MSPRLSTRCGAAVALLTAWLGVAQAATTPAKPATPPATPAPKTTSAPKSTAPTAPKPSAPKTPAAKPSTGSAHQPAAQPATPTPDMRSRAARIAADVRSLDEQGSFGLAADQMQLLRKLLPPDPDLELAIAIDLARSGEPDSAAVRLYGPMLTAALDDTADVHRFQVYGWRHENTYFGGKFTGWHWYIARARLEVEAARGRWTEALAAARVCTRARPKAGLEWYLLALCAAHTGALDEARAAIDRALVLDPVLPDAHHLAGELAWRLGRRMAAQEEFRAAIALDPSFVAPAVSLARARLPVGPDSLPAALLSGLRGLELVTSPGLPKYDNFEQLERVAAIANSANVTIPDSLAGRVKPLVVHPLVLFDAMGHPVVRVDPWTAATTVPDELIGLIATVVSTWEVTPALKEGRAVPIWLQLDVNLVAAQPQGK